MSRDTIDGLKRRIAQRKAIHRATADLEARLVLLVAKQLRREMRAGRKRAA